MTVESIETVAGIHVPDSALAREVTEFMKKNPTAVDPSARLTGWGKFVLPSEEERDVWDYVGDPGSEAGRLETDSCHRARFLSAGSIGTPAACTAKSTATSPVISAIVNRSPAM